MIMKNEAARLGRCLNSVRGLCDEIIIVDTGSSDRSPEIATSYGAKVIHDPWQDDFARPRNIGLDRARCNWVLILDPDEILLPQHHLIVKQLTQRLDFAAFWVSTLNWGPFCHEHGYRTAPDIKDPLGHYPGYRPSTKTRFFKNGLGIRFEGCYHELVDYFLVRNKLRIGRAHFPVHHWTHEIVQSSLQEKKELYLRLGAKKVREFPTMGQAWWEYGVSQMIYGDRANAVKSIATAIRLGRCDSEQYFALARCLELLLNKKQSALAFEKGICDLYPNLTHIDNALKLQETLLNSI